jgi:CHAD domain-containing protein
VADSGNLEVEAKFRVHPSFRLPELAGSPTGVIRVSDPDEQALRAVYWDTADLRLSREGITLRHRSGEGTGDGWHLKLPVQEAGIPDTGVGAREEIHDGSPPEQVPAELLDLVAVHLRSAVVGPVATLCTRRTVRQLFGVDDLPLAELTDDAVSVLSQGHVVARFREIEVEDRGGGLTVLGEVGTVLRAAGAVAGEFVPKVVRALGPQATAVPDPPPAGPVSPGDTTRAMVQSVLRRYVRNFMRRDVDARRGADDAVHQMRVAARRLRSALRTFRPVLDVAWANALREELAWVTDELGIARDAEVMLARLHRELAALPDELVIGPVRSRIDAMVGADFDRGTAVTAELLRSDRYMALVDRLVSAAWDPMTTPAADAKAGDVVPALLLEVWRRFDRRARRLTRGVADDHQWHKARISAKQARYALDAASPLFGAQAKKLASQAEKVQELLGEHQDAVVTAEVIRRLAAAPRGGAISFTLGILYARQLDAMDRTRSEFPRLWKPMAKVKRRRWLTA